MAHQQHPSLVKLKQNSFVKKGSIEYLRQVSSVSQVIEPPLDPAGSIDEERLKYFSHAGEKYFKILVDNIKTYKDKQFKEEQYTQNTMNKDDIVRGTYITDKIVLFGEPYNVYIKSSNVEPVDLDHASKSQQNVSNSQQNPLKSQNNIDMDEKSLLINKKSIFEDDSEIELVDNGQIDVNDDENVKLIGIDVNDNKSKRIKKNNYNKSKNDQKHDEESGLLDNNFNIQYSKIGATSSTDNYESIWKKIFQSCCSLIVFTLSIVLDVLLIVYLYQLNDIVNNMNISMCSVDSIQMIYNKTYIIVEYMSFVGLLGFIGLLMFYFYFKKQKILKTLERNIFIGVDFMMLLLYMLMTLYQMMTMRSNIDNGLIEAKDDSECYTNNNHEIDNISTIDGILRIVIILKLLEAIALCMLSIAVFCFLKAKSL